MNRQPLGSTIFHMLKAFGLCVLSLLGPRPALAAASDHHVIVVCIDGFAAYLLNDPKAPVPTLRKLAREGAVAAGGMKVSNPSVTWPNHTSLVTGVRPEKHGVLANGVLVRSALAFRCSSIPRRTRKTWCASPRCSTWPTPTV